MILANYHGDTGIFSLGLLWQNQDMSTLFCKSKSKTVRSEWNRILICWEHPIDLNKIVWGDISRVNVEKRVDKKRHVLVTPRPISWFLLICVCLLWCKTSDWCTFYYDRRWSEYKIFLVTNACDMIRWSFVSLYLSWHMRDWFEKLIRNQSLCSQFLS